MAQAGTTGTCAGTKLKQSQSRPLTIVVTKGITDAERVMKNCRSFSTEREDSTAAARKAKVLCVTYASKHQPAWCQTRMVDNRRATVEWIISVSMLSEGGDVKKKFIQIVPHEESAFNSKLLIARARAVACGAQMDGKR